jgi:predicted nucleic acid-binding Zn ribbon protein
MNYLFKCQNCGAEQQKEICIKEYDRLKNLQVCIKCGGAMKRVIEWRGIASGSGSGWCGKSTGNTI